jgi:signal transduction histidine kinase
VRVDVPAAAAVLTVADTGIGIDEVHIDHVFDRFYKVDTSRKHDEDGRSGGLGLSICRAIVERHRGTITVSSGRGAGTTMTVRLPIARPPQAAQPAPPACDTPA